VKRFLVWRMLLVYGVDFNVVGGSVHAIKENGMIYTGCSTS
jgi:hypothetical protein